MVSVLSARGVLAKHKRIRSIFDKEPTHRRAIVALNGDRLKPLRMAFERSQNAMLAYDDADAFAVALLEDTPPRPPEQEAIVARNRRGTVPTPR